MVGWTRQKRASAARCEAANRDVLSRGSYNKRKSSESSTTEARGQPSVGHGRKKAKLSPLYEDDDKDGAVIDQSTLKVGSRILVIYKSSLFKATIRKRRYENNQHEFMIHYDGNKKTTVHWIPRERIYGTLENDNMDSESLSLTSTKRKRGQQSTLEDTTSSCGDEQQESRKKCSAPRPGCTVNGCRNPIAGCPDFTKIGVCWYHGENQSGVNNQTQQDDEKRSSPQRRNPGRAGRATLAAMAMEDEVSSGDEGPDGSPNCKRKDVKRKAARRGTRQQALKTCNHKQCTNKALKGGVCWRHGAKKTSGRKCSHNGCTNYAINGGVCTRHGAKRPVCSHKGCTNIALIRGVCWRHGAKDSIDRRCSQKGCTNYVVQGGVCRRHGAKIRKCSRKGCTNITVKGGVCWRHGAKLL